MAIPKPITRVEQYLASIAGASDVTLPAYPITREEYYLASWAEKSGFEIAEVDGTPPLVLKDCIGEQFKGLVLYGKSTQVTTTGAQLFEPISDSLNLNGVVITFGKNGEKIVVSGTAVLSQEIQISKPIQMQAGEKYVLTLDEVHYFENIWLQGNGVRFGWSGKNTANKVIITVPDSIAERTDCAMYASVKEGEACNFTINHLMLNAGDTALPWEPYTGGKPSPSPDYPQEIRNAGDGGNLSVIVKNPDNEQMQSVLFSTPNGLPGIPVSSGGNYTDEQGQQWVCDEVNLERGVYVKRVYSVIVDGVDVVFSQKGPYCNINLRNMPSAKIVYASSQKAATKSTFTSEPWNFNQELGFLYIKKENYDEILNESCRRHNGEIIYALATPIETPLSETDIAAYRALTTYKGTTILESECYLKVKYSKLRK